MATLLDIAKAAGVSKMTVSNALRGKANVSETTRRKIIQTAKALNYQTNLAARALSSGRNGIIELIVQDLDSPFYGKLSKELSLAAERVGMQMLTCQALYSAENEKEALGGIRNLFCDGLVLATPRINAAEAQRLAQHRPLVLIDADLDGQSIPMVNTPNYEGVYQATRHLIEQGVRRPLLLGACPEYLSGHMPAGGNSAYLHRFQGAYDALQRSQLDLEPEQCVALDWTFENARSAIHDQVRHHQRFDGIIAMSDTVALGVIRGLFDLGVSVPDDVKVVGFDGSTMSAFSTPSLTTVEIDMVGMTEQIMNILLARFDGDTASDDNESHTAATAPFTLRIRESSTVATA